MMISISVHQKHQQKGCTTLFCWVGLLEGGTWWHGGMGPCKGFGVCLWLARHRNAMVLGYALFFVCFFNNQSDIVTATVILEVE